MASVTTEFPIHVTVAFESRKAYQQFVDYAENQIRDVTPCKVVPVNSRVVELHTRMPDRQASTPKHIHNHQSFIAFIEHVVKSYRGRVIKTTDSTVANDAEPAITGPAVQHNPNPALQAQLRAKRKKCVGVAEDVGNRKKFSGLVPAMMSQREWRDITGWLTPTGAWLRFTGSHVNTLASKGTNVASIKDAIKMGFVHLSDSNQGVEIECLADKVFMAERWLRRNGNTGDVISVVTYNKEGLRVDKSTIELSHNRTFAMANTDPNAVAWFKIIFDDPLEAENFANDFIGRGGQARVNGTAVHTKFRVKDTENFRGIGELVRKRGGDFVEILGTPPEWAKKLWRRFKTIAPAMLPRRFKGLHKPGAFAFDFDVPVGGSTLSKRALSIAIAEELGIAQAKTLSVVRMTLDKLALALMNGQRVELRGFGVFEMRRRKSRMRSNPNTGKIQHQPETFYVHFKPSQKIHEPRPGVYPGARFSYALAKEDAKKWEPHVRHVILQPGSPKHKSIHNDLRLISGDLPYRVPIHEVKILHPSNKKLRVGTTYFTERTKGELYPESVFTSESFRRQGVATAMYEKMRGKGYTIPNAKVQTTEGKKFRGTYRWYFHDPRMQAAAGIALMAAGCAAIEYGPDLIVRASKAMWEKIKSICTKNGGQLRQEQEAAMAYAPTEGVRMPAMQIPTQQETPGKQQSTEIKLYFEGEDLADEASLWLRQNGVQVRRPFEHSHKLTAIGDRKKINEAVDKFKGSPCKPRHEVGTDQQAAASYDLAHLSMGPAVEFMLSSVSPEALHWLANRLINFGCEVIREQGKNALRVTAYGLRGPEAVRRLAAKVGAQVQKVAMSYAMGAPGTQMILRSRGTAPTPTKVLADLMGSLFDAGIRAARRGKGIMAWISSQAELNKAKRIAQINSMILESAMTETKRLRPDMVYSFGHENGYELGVGPTEVVEFVFSNALMVAAGLAYLRSKGLSARRNGKKSIMCKVAEGGDRVMGSVYRTMDKHFEATVKMIMPGTEFLPSGGIHDFLPHGARVKLKKAQDVMGRAAKIPGQAKRMVEALPGAFKEAVKQGPKGFVPRTKGETVLALTVTFATAAAAAAAAHLIMKLGVKVKQAGQKLFAKPTDEKQAEDVEQIVKASQGKIVAASFMAEEAPMDWKIVFTSTSAAKHAYMPIATKYGFNPGVNISPRSKNIIFLNTKHSLITRIYDEYRLHGQAVDIQALGGYHPPAPGEGQHGGPAGPGGGGAPVSGVPNMNPWADTGVPHDFRPGTNAKGKDLPLDQYFTQFVIDFGGIIAAQRALAWLQRSGISMVGEDGHGRLYVTLKNLLTRSLMAVVAAFRGKVVRKSSPSRKPQPVPTGRAAAPAAKVQAQAPAKQTIMPSQKPTTKSPTKVPKAKKSAKGAKETQKPEETKVTTIKDFRKQSKKPKGKGASHGAVAMALPLAAVGWWVIKDVLPYAATLIAADLLSSGILAKVKPNGEIVAQGDPVKIEKVAKRRERRARVARAAKEVAGHKAASHDAASMDWNEQLNVAKHRLGDIKNWKAAGKAVYMTVAFAANAYLLGKFIKECTDAGAKTVTRPSGEVTVLTVDPERIKLLAKDNKAISVKLIEV